MDICNGTLVCVFLHLHKYTAAITVRITKSKSPSMKMHCPWVDRTTCALCNWVENSGIPTSLFWQPADKEMQSNLMHEKTIMYTFLNWKPGTVLWVITLREVVVTLQNAMSNRRPHTAAVQLTLFLAVLRHIQQWQIVSNLIQMIGGLVKLCRISADVFHYKTHQWAWLDRHLDKQRYSRYIVIKWGLLYLSCLNFTGGWNS